MAKIYKINTGSKENYESELIILNKKYQVVCKNGLIITDNEIVKEHFLSVFRYPHEVVKQDNEIQQDKSASSVSETSGYPKKGK